MLVPPFPMMTPAAMLLSRNLTAIFCVLLNGLSATSSTRQTPGQCARFKDRLKQDVPFSILVRTLSSSADTETLSKLEFGEFI